jgi:hypothetical protein
VRLLARAHGARLKRALALAGSALRLHVLCGWLCLVKRRCEFRAMTGGRLSGWRGGETAGGEGGTERESLPAELGLSVCPGLSRRDSMLSAELQWVKASTHTHSWLQASLADVTKLETYKAGMYTRFRNGLGLLVPVMAPDEGRQAGLQARQGR